MLNKLSDFIRQQKLMQPGDSIVCAVSGGADSMALLWALYLLRKKLDIQISCAHFNHNLRGEESHRDALFVENFCKDYSIPFYLGEANVVSGKKGLEAAAREARYGFLRSFDGIVATAHTADDNGETLLMHLVRGTGLRGLGGIAPKNGNIIRPMLTITREEVLEFLKQYSIAYVEDSSNATDDFLRNRLRHRIIPLLKAENPRLAQSLSETALRLRADEMLLASQVAVTDDVQILRQMDPALRARALCGLLEQSGVPEPEAQHIALAEDLVFSERPSASGNFPGGVTLCRNYNRLEIKAAHTDLRAIPLGCPDRVVFGNFAVTTQYAKDKKNSPFCFTVSPVGNLVVRPRQTGDCIHFSYGSKSLKKLFIDEKIPACERNRIPVISDDNGVIGVCGYGPDMARPDGDIFVEIQFENL